MWLNADQVADILQVSRRTALALMYQMPHSVISGKTRKRIRVSRNALDAWMEKQSNKPSGNSTVSTGSKRRLARR